MTRSAKKIFRDPHVRGAFKLHEQFREAKPTRARIITAPALPRALMVLGELEFVGYRTTHGGKVHRYCHTFHAGSMPRLAAGPKLNQLYLLGGRYHVTDRGIVDLSVTHEELEDEAHGVAMPLLTKD